MAVGARVALAEGGGDVVGADLALPPGVLGGHRVERARVLQIGHGGRVAAGEHLGPARHLERGLDQQPAALQGEPGGLGERVGADADAPHQGAGVDELAVGEQHALGGGLLHGGAHPHVDTAFAQHLVGGAGEPFVQLGQDLLRHVEEQPARAHPGAQRVLLHQLIGEHLPLRGDLGAGVAGADHHECAARGAGLGIVGGGGQLDLAGDVVAQIEGLGQAPEAVRVLGDAGDGQQFVDAAGGEHQPVVAERALVALGVGVVHRTGVEVDAVGLAEHQFHLRQGAGEGDGDPAGLQDAGGHLGQQGEVEEVVRRVEQGDVGLAPGQLGQRAGGLVAGESGSDDQNAGSAHDSPPAVVGMGWCPVV